MAGSDERLVQMFFHRHPDLRREKPPEANFLQSGSSIQLVHR